MLEAKLDKLNQNLEALIAALNGQAKVTTVAPQQPAPTPTKAAVKVAEPVKAVEKPAANKEVTVDDCSKLVVKIVGEKGMPGRTKVVELLGKYSVTKASLLSAEQAKTFYAEALLVYNETPNATAAA